MMDTITVSCEEYKALVKKAVTLEAIIRMAKASEFGRIDAEVVCTVAGVPYQKEDTSHEKVF